MAAKKQHRLPKNYMEKEGYARALPTKEMEAVRNAFQRVLKFFPEPLPSPNENAPIPLNKTASELLYYPKQQVADRKALVNCMDKILDLMSSLMVNTKVVEPIPTPGNPHPKKKTTRKKKSTKKKSTKRSTGNASMWAS
jgi:hypothetical protein